MKKLHRFFITGALLFLSSALFASPAHFTLIIDAGSTGSRLHLFQYEAASRKIPLIQDIFTENTSPGLSFFANNPEAASQPLKKLLDDAMQALQKNNINPRDVSIHILATAGMRLLPKDTQASIYKHIRHFLITHYPFKIGDIKTIPGKMEGLYGWLDINYLSKAFEHHHDITKGSIDMGGASTQIVFSTADNSKPEDEIRLRIGENTYTVFSKSFLGLGLKEALRHLKNDPLESSCYPRHYFFSSEMQGDFNFSVCSSLSLNLIRQHQVTQQILPAVNQDFIAYSGIYYVYNFFGVVDTASQSTVEKHIQATCGKTWEQLLKDNPHTPETYLASYCANGVYIFNLLYREYALDDKHLIVANKINNHEIDWTLGALLYRILHAENRTLNSANPLT